MSTKRAISVLLALLPFVAVCFSVSLWDRVYPLVLGVPFNMAWLIACIPLTSICLWVIYRLREPDTPGTSGIAKDGSR